MTNLLTLGVPFVPFVPVLTRKNVPRSTPPTSSFRLGTSGQEMGFSLSDRLFATRALNILEVTTVGNSWVTVGRTGQAREETLASINRNVSKGSPSSPRRARMWKFSVPLLHPDTQRRMADLDRLSQGLQKKSIDRYMWLLHDRDEGSAPHVQGALKLSDSRTKEQLASSLGLPAASLQPIVDRSGQHGAFERYCRYLLHESPEARADGKALYLDSDVHANFDFRTMIDGYFGFASSAPVLTVDEIKLKLYSGELSPDDVESLHPRIFIRHVSAFETLYERGKQKRVMRELLAERAARQEMERRRQEEGKRSGDDTPRDEIGLAVGESLTVGDHAANPSEIGQLDAA